MSTEEEIDQAVAPEPMPRQPVNPFGTPPDAPGNFGGASTAQLDPPVPEVREVDYATAIEEEKAKPDPVLIEPEDDDEPEDVLDALVSRVAPKTWKIGPEGSQLEYTQKRLSFVGKMEWFALVADVLDTAMSGPDGVSLNEVMSAPGQRGKQLRMDDFRDADTFVRAISKLVKKAPSFLLDSYVIWLGVDERERELVKQIMSFPEEDGGLSDDDGLEIIEIFIDQNFEAISDFFENRATDLARRVRERNEERLERKKTKKKVRAARQ